VHGFKLVSVSLLVSCRYFNIYLIYSFSCNCVGKRILRLVRLMPDFLPNQKIKIAISSFDKNKQIYIPLSTNDDESKSKDEELGRNTRRNSIDDRKREPSRPCFACCIKVPPEMNELTNKDGKSGKDLDGNETTLKDEKNQVLNRTYFCCCNVPLEMDDRIIESGLKVLESNQEFKSKKELEKKKKAYRDKIEDGLSQMKRQLDSKIMERFDKIEQKLDKTTSNRARLSIMPEQ
jgi:hypothetical protein